MAKRSKSKSFEMREFLRRHPGATLDAVAAGTSLERAFISSIASQWVRKGIAAGSAADGYTLIADSDGRPPKVRGNRAALRRARSVQRGARAKAADEVRIALTPAGASAIQVGGDHYRSLAVQPWDAMQAWMSQEAFGGFLIGNAIKYIARHKAKGGVEDLRKARHYLDKLIEVAGDRP
jgi:hypothetical protein